jgi:pSer/pThr/pTyr-binding forkhead associated (FHA) protein
MSKLVYDGKEFPLVNELVMGRHRDNPIPLADGKASRRHARVFVKEDRTEWVEDLDSANGTLVNGEEIFSPRQLKDGDRIVIGKCKVVYRSDAPEASPPAGSPVAADPAEMVGKLVGGYRIGALLAAGSMGVVYKAKQLSLDREVAVKIFNAEVTKRDQDFAERFLREARVAGSVPHPSVVQIHECGQQDNLLWYSMELVDGETLEDLLARDGRFEPLLALIVSDQAAAALQAAHAKGLVHGDVTPANLMLSKEGKIKLLDLGLAKVLNSGRAATRAKKAAVGNPWYMSPERAKGEAGDARSDIYSLGCVLFHLLSGGPPFDDDHPKAILKAHLESPIPSLLDKVPNLPKKLDELVHSMLSKNPEWRHGTMEEVIADLKSARELLPKAGEARKATKAAAPAPSGAAFQAAAERAQERLEEHRHHRVRGVLVFSLVVVLLLVAYSFSGISLPTFIHNLENQGANGGATAPGTPGGEPPVVGVGPATPPAALPQPGALPPAGAEPAVSAAGERWRAVQAEVDGYIAGNSWGAAEMALSRFAASVAKPDGLADLRASVKLKQAQLSLDGAAWYRSQITALPPATAPRLARLNEVRDVALSGQRGEAEGLYQETLAKLTQLLSAAKRKARRELEAGHPENLPALANDLAPSFSGTPVEGLQRQFAVLTKEAVGVRKLWRGDWTATREQLPAAKGADALSAAAALILSDAPGPAHALVMGDAALAAGELLRRREQLLGREAAILSFTSVTDLQFLDIRQGEPHLDAGAGVFTGAPGAPVGIGCTVPVGGPNWEVAMTISLKDHAGKVGQAQLSCVRNENAEFLLRIEGASLSTKIHAAAGIEEQQPERPPGDPLHIRIACRGNRLQVLINSVAVAACAQARIPSGCQVRLDLADAQWQLRELQVVGGE